MNSPWLRPLTVGTALLAGVALVFGSQIVPLVLLLRLDDAELDRWADIGQALTPVSVFFSGVAFVGIVLTLFLQGRELQNQREELTLAREEQQRSSEIALRQLHTDLIRMAIDDPELRSVWPPIAPGKEESKKDHYCNLILNLQKVAYEAGTIELPELQGALRHLMGSPDMYVFWREIRAARRTVTSGDEAEDFFTAQVDQAFEATTPPPPRATAAIVRGALNEWRANRRHRRDS